MAKKVQLMTNAKEWQTVNGVEVLVDVPQEDLDPITDSNCVEIEGHRTLEETISQENMFTPEIVETKVHSKVGGVYHDNVVDGAYEEAILYGNTQVNLVESVTAGTKYIPHSFTSFQGNESKIGNYNNGRTNQVAPLVKGVTMVNLVPQGNMTLKGGAALSVYNIKGDTEYTLKFTFTQKNNMAGIVIQSFKDENGTLTYLENSKLQSGLGDEVAITFTAHEQANRVHICNGSEYGGETIQLDNIMVIEGDVTDLDLPFFKGMCSVELSRPLTNLFTDDLRTASLFGGTATNSGGTVVATAESIGTWKGMSYFLDNKLKPNTKYLVMWNSLTQTQTSTTNTDVIIGAYHHDGDTVTTRLGTINGSPLCPTMRSIIFDTGNYDVTQISIRVHATLTNSETGTTTVTGLRVFEYDDSLRTLDLQTIGYFSGTKYVSVRALETEGKNLYPYGDINFTPTSTGWFDAKGNGNMYGDIAQKSKGRFLLKKGTYYLSMGEGTNISSVQLVDDKEEMLSYTPLVLEQDTYLTIRVNTSQSNVPTTLTNIQIERGETATTYEAYQSRYYKPRETEEIILRSLPNGVCDTFNLQTGELVQRVGEIVLDGSEDENWYEIKMVEKGDYIQNNTEFLNHLRLRYGSIVSPNISVVDSKEWENPTKQGIYSGGNLGLTLLTSNLTTLDKEGWCAYLSQNPITVQYELTEPIITKLQTYNRVYSGQTNAPTSMGNNLSALTYYSSNYYLKVGNLSPVPAILEPITTIPYDVRLKPSTLYTIKYNRGGNSNSMSFDLGGSVVEKTNSTTLDIVPEEFTVRTPAILSHEQIRLSGTGYANNFIVVEGDITGTELPYFEGMCNVKMPIVKNIGKNLFDGVVKNGEGWWDGKVQIEKNFRRSVNLTPVKPNTEYVFKLTNHYGIGCGANFMAHGKDGKFLKYIGWVLSDTSKFTTPSDCYYIHWYNDIDDFTDFYIEEASTPSQYEPYKENSVYAVQGEIGLSQDMFEVGAVLYSNQQLGTKYETMKSNDFNHRARLKDLISIKPDTVYNININNDKHKIVLHYFDASEGSIQKETGWIGESCSIKTPTDAYKVNILLSYKNDSQITLSTIDFNAYQILELDSTVQLRSLPNGVKDELNLLTGEYIQRVGEVVLDGSEEQQWSIGRSTNANLLDFYIHNIIPNALNNGDGISDKFNYVNGVWNTQVAGICVNLDKGISMMLPTKYVKTQDLQGCLEWLQQNPITVQYELAEPIISHVRLVSNNQEREVGVKLPNGVCDTYNPSTGITVKRVGKAILDGSEDWKQGELTNDTHFEAWLPSSPLKDMKLSYEGYMEGYFTNMFKVDGWATPHMPSIGLIDGRMSVKCGTTHHLGAVSIGILKSKLPTQDVDGFKAYLKSNPLIVYYELANPIVTTDIVLPNGVHDEYNPLTGLYTKRVGYVELDGSDNERWKLGTSATGTEVNTKLFLSPCPQAQIIAKKEDCNIICDKLPYLYELYDTDQEGIHIFSNTTHIAIRIAKSKLSEETLVGLKQHLAQNPIKVWYELATPITYQLTPYFGLPQPYAYEDGYLIHESAYPETTLPPEFKYKLVANRTGQIVQNNRKLQEHTTRLSNLEALIIEATIESLFNRELQLFELELMDIQLIDLGE